MKILKLALLILICKNLSGQIYNYPAMSYKINPTTSILKIEINDKYTIVEEEYKCSYQYDSGYFGISNNSFIKSNGRYYKLLKTEGIAVSPNKTYCKQKGSSYKYKLFFEKIKPSKKIDVIEDTINGGFNFYDVELINNKEQSEWNMAKTDEFVKYIPYELHYIFLNNDFISKKDKIIKYLDGFVEKELTDNLTKITFQEEEDCQSYLCKVSNVDNVESIKFSQKNKSPLLNGFDEVTIYFTENESALNFYRSLINYFNYTSYDNRNFALKFIFTEEIPYILTAGIKNSALNAVTIYVYDNDTYMKLVKK